MRDVLTAVQADPALAAIGALMFAALVLLGFVCAQIEIERRRAGTTTRQELRDDSRRAS